MTEQLLQRMAAQLRHRGPDDEGTARPAPGVGLGHTRLSIIDLSAAGHQPMANAAKTAWIVYNGEIYNYRTLRDELQRAGAVFVSQSDTEVILHAYERWGLDCLEHLDGMFAFGLWDARQQQLFCARDRTGKKPLFYYEGPSVWAFASEIKALLVHPGIPDEINLEALPAYLAHGYVPSPDTFYRGIRQLPPGCRLVLSRQRRTAEVTPYWEVHRRVRRTEPSAAEARTEVRRLVTEAVRKRLIADVPLGAFLSGGLDSTIVVGVMSQLMDQPVRTFSIGFSGDARFDETRYARIAARRFGTRHTEFIVEPQAFELLDTLVYHHDQPFGDSSAIPAFLLSRLTRQQVTVALNGDGGDELFAGYLRFAVCVRAERWPLWMRRRMHHLAQRLAGWSGRHHALASAARLCEAARLPPAERLFRLTAYFPQPEEVLHPELAGLVRDDRLMGNFREIFQASPNGTLLSKLLYVNLREYLAGDLHVKMDRCSMAHGLETRSPLLDTALIEYALGLPDAMKLRGWRTKVILRDAFADLLPPEIQHRGKWGFGVPLGAWFRTSLRARLQELLLDPQAQWLAYLRREAVQQLVDEHLLGARDHSQRLWSLLTLETWLRLRKAGALLVSHA
ncbi:MAG: asparagine synthase (glutamine-hydrolyzing) [Candidatus Omnitrophica bacterium]|nr:asparagine synthase (glutamine-hydrolyzing) [Candidatus Omnitrophota bacterium]